MHSLFTCPSEDSRRTKKGHRENKPEVPFAFHTKLLKEHRLLNAPCLACTPSPERGDTFTEQYLGIPFHTVTDGTDTRRVGLTQEGSTVPTLNLTHATIPSNKQRKAPSKRI